MNPYSTDLSEEEKKLLKQYEESQNAGQFGSLVGSGIGAGVGALGFLAGPAVGAGTMSLGYGAGQAIGGLIGGEVGRRQAEEAETALEELRKKREAPTIEKQARAEALQRLLSKYSVYGV
jgi:phage tail tape-measure protein